MSFIHTTPKQFAKEFQKFKEARPDYSSERYSGVQLARWNNEFLNLKLYQAWKQGMMDSKKIIEDYPDTDTPVSDFTEAIMREVKNSAPC